MGKLDGKIVLVPGGAGNIGGNIVRGALRAGATVIALSREAQRFERLERFINASGSAKNLVTLVGDVGDERDILRLRDEIVGRFGKLDAVIASLGGGMMEQRLVDMPLDVWNEVLHNNLASHFLSAKTFLPLLLQRNQGVYLLISGYGGEVAWAGSAPVSIAAAGVISLGRNLAAEHKDSHVRIKPMVLATGEHLWGQFQNTPGAYRGEDVGDFMAWLASDEGAEAKADVIRFVTDWNKANEIRQF
jgi:NAD(P)-dependent dehydrogenase (short-subunit alcohol dehydrogenase family)